MSKQVKVIFALLLGVVALCVGLILRPGQEGSVAVIRRDGEIVGEIHLDALDGPYTFPVDGEGEQYNIVVAEHGRICVQKASCPDQICVHQGWISDSSAPIVCLPNKLIIEIVGEEGEFDAVTK